MDPDDVEEAIIAKTVRNRKGVFPKNATEIILKVKHKARQGKSFGAPPIRIPPSILATKPCTDETTFHVVHYDVWMHISDFIRPEAIGTFALICQQTAQIVRTRRFWLNQLKRYCHCLYDDGDLLMGNNVVLRQKVIELYFNRYPLFKERILAGYSTDVVLGRSFMQCWNRDLNNVYTLVYAFKTQYNDKTENVNRDTEDACTEVADNWEDLDIPAISPPSSIRSIYEGIFLVVVHGNYFMPPPFHLQSKEKLRVIAIRKLLCKDMRCCNLELDFKYLNTQSVIIVKHPSVHQVNIIPWWHPQFYMYMGVI